MNCLLEAVAGAYLTVRGRLIPDPVDEEVYSAQARSPWLDWLLEPALTDFCLQDGLEGSRRAMEARERELVEEVRRLGEQALACKRAGDVVRARACCALCVLQLRNTSGQGAARTRVLERRRGLKRLDKLRNGIGLVDSQLDAIKTSELDKEIMLTLKASTTAMKKAGIGVAVEEAETMMGELDGHIRDVQDVTRALAQPMLSDLDDPDALDAELDWLEETPLLERDAPRPLPRKLPTVPEPHAEDDDAREPVLV
jgi:hypothetical protein